MKVFIGDKITSEFGTGKLVAVTKEWIVHEVEDGNRTYEVAISIDDSWVTVPAELPGPCGGRSFVDIKTESNNQ